MSSWDEQVVVFACVEVTCRGESRLMQGVLERGVCGVSGDGV